MNIERLQEFAFLADSLSFAETAQHFYMSQSVLSKHIAALEEELDVKLFIRDSHHVALTEAGATFKQDVDGILSQYDRSLVHLSTIRNESEAYYEATVGLGFMRVPSRPFIASFLARMNQEYPHIRIALRSMEYDHAMYAFSTGGIDMAFGLHVDAEEETQAEVLDIYEDHFMAVVSRDNPLSAFDSITLDRLRGQKILLPDPQSYTNVAHFVRSALPDYLTVGQPAIYRDSDRQRHLLFEGKSPELRGLFARIQPRGLRRRGQVHTGGRPGLALPRGGLRAARQPVARNASLLPGAGTMPRRPGNSRKETPRCRLGALPRPHSPEIKRTPLARRPPKPYVRLP